MQRQRGIRKRQYVFWFSLFAILLPFLHQYKGIGSFISLGEVLIGFVTALLLLSKSQTKLNGYDKSLLLFYAVSLWLTMLCAIFPYFSASEAFTVIIRLLFYGIIIYVGRKYFDLKEVLRIYYFALFAFSAYLIIQYIYHLGTGGYLPIYLNYSWQFPPEARSYSLAQIYRFNYRASSLFLEPSYFTFYALPGVCLLLYQKKKKTFEKIALIISIIAIALSTASSGVVGVVIIVVIYLFGRPNQNLGRKIVIVSAATLFAIGYFTVLENASIWTINRLVRGGSINERIVRGILIYNQLPALNKIIGVGLNNLGAYMQTNGISTVYDETNLNYASSVIQTLNYSGIIGIIALLNYYFHVFKKARNGEQRNNSSSFERGITVALVVSLFYTSVFEAILFTYRFAYMVLLIEGSRKMEIEGV